MDFGSDLNFGNDNELDFENRILSTFETGEDRENTDNSLRPQTLSLPLANPARSYKARFVIFPCLPRIGWQGKSPRAKAR